VEKDKDTCDRYSLGFISAYGKAISEIVLNGFEKAG
jgi:hypothetical protein